MPEIDVRAHAHASPQRACDLLVDVESWRDWAPLDEITVEQGHEVGEIRRVPSGRITTLERVIAFDPPRRYAYQIVSGLPIRDYVAQVLLAPVAGDGTDIKWQARFQPIVPGTGWVMKRLMGRTITKGADALVRRADGLS